MKKPERKDLLAVIQDLSLPTLPAPMELAGDYLIVGDVHVPYTDWALALRVAQVAKHEGITRLICAGDFWNYDAYSSYPPTMLLPSWKTEKAAGKALAGEWAQTFEEIIFLMGNHERRKQKLTMGEEDDEDIFSPLASVANIRSTCYGWANVQSGGVPWLIAHPKEYSINQLVVADAQAQKYSRNIITLHEHHTAMGYDRYGRYVVVNCGCLVDPRKLAYVQMDTNKKAAMVPSFAMLKGGRARLFSDVWTDWGDYERPATSARRAGRGRAAA